MKKFLITLILIIFMALIFKILFFLPEKNVEKNKFTEKDLLPARFDKINGFYRIWTLTEPPDVDVESEEVINNYKKLFYPKFKIKELKGLLKLRHKELFFKSDRRSFPFPTIYEDDWINHLLSNNEEIRLIESTHRIYFKRYEGLIKSEIIEDLADPNEEVCTCPDCLNFIKTAKLYTTINMLDALEGNWEHSISNILNQINCYKKVVKSSRSIVLNLIAKNIFSYSLISLSTLMNNHKCPQKVFEQILEGLTPLSYGEFGSKNAIIGDYFLFDKDIDDLIQKDEYLPSKNLMYLFLQKSILKQYLFKALNYIIEYEKMPPYKWPKEFEIMPLEYEINVPLFFQYYKRIYNILESGSHRSPIFKSYKLKCYYDLVRISAELHLEHKNGKPMDELQRTLQNNKTFDPCSGKPYIWDKKKQIIYGIGTDRDDDGGKVIIGLKDTDFTLRFILN